MQEKLGRFCPHMVQLLSEWMETFPYDFRDERVMAHVRQLTQRCVALDTSLRRDVSQMLHNLLHRLTALEKYEEFLEKINTEANSNLIDTVAVVTILSHFLFLWEGGFILTYLWWIYYRRM